MEMTYNIVQLNDTVVVEITEGRKTDTLSLANAPSAGSILVQQSKKDVLGEINLEKLLVNLDNCVDLLQITYNAVDGFDVQGKVQVLSNKFIDAMNKSNTTAYDFQLATADAIEAYIFAYGNLFLGDIEIALEFLTGTRDMASAMVEKADELVVIFNDLTNFTNSVLVEVMATRADDEKKRAETEALILELDGSIKAMTEIKENLASDIAQYDADYQNMLKREIKQEERAHEMQMASMIINAIAAIFGAAGNAASNSADRDDAERTAGEEGGPSAETKAKREYVDNIAKQEQQNALIEKADARIARIDEVLDLKLYAGGENNASVEADDPDAKKTDAELRAEKQALVDEKDKKNAELSLLKGKEQTLGTTLTGFGVALDKISQDTREAARETQKAAEKLADRAEAIRKRRDELKDQERKNIKQLAENTAKMQNMVIDKNALESAIQCLVIAIGCLRRVLAYLQDIKLFWMSVEVFCENLAGNDNLSKMIAMQRNKTPEQRAAYFKTQMFVKGYIGIMAKWQALNVIFTEYKAALNHVSARMKDTLKQEINPDRTVQWRLANQLAGSLKDKLQLELKA